MGKVKFQVVVENVDLSKAQIAAIQKEINSAVAGELLKTKMAKLATPGLPVLAYKIPPEWLGIWIRGLKIPGNFGKFGGKDLGKFGVK